MEDVANPITAPAKSTTLPQQSQFQTERVLTIVSGHFVHDMYSSFLSPLLPKIIEKLSLTLTQAGVLSALTPLPAVLNPFIGYAGDKISLRYFIILAPAITGTLMSIMGLAPNFTSLAILLVASGVSVAAFHAPAPAMISRISGNKIGLGMGLFMAAGELGRTIGPLLIVWAISTWALEGMARVAVLSWLMSILLFWRLRTIPASGTKQQQDFRQIFSKSIRVFLPLFAIALLPGFQTTALSAWLPTLMESQGASFEAAAASLSIFQFAGVAGALLSGPLSDRLGRKPTLFFGYLVSPILVLIFLNTSGMLTIPLLILTGFISLSTTPVVLAIIQDYFPLNRGAATGMFMSIAFLVRALASYLIGVIGDAFDLRFAFFISALIALLAVPSLLLLPKITDITTNT